MQTQKSVIDLNARPPLPPLPVITERYTTLASGFAYRVYEFFFPGFEHEAPISMPDFCCLRIDLHHDAQQPIAIKQNKNFI